MCQAERWRRLDSQMRLGSITRGCSLRTSLLLANQRERNTEIASRIPRANRLTRRSSRESVLHRCLLLSGRVACTQPGTCGASPSAQIRDLYCLVLHFAISLACLPRTLLYTRIQSWLSHRLQSPRATTTSMTSLAKPESRSRFSVFKREMIL